MTPFPPMPARPIYSCGGTTGCGPCETCGAGTTCVAAPHPTCRTPDAPTRLRIDNTAVADFDRVLWNGGGWPFSRGDFGDPVGAPFDYALCMYDESGATGSL